MIPAPRGVNVKHQRAMRFGAKGVEVSVVTICRNVKKDHMLRYTGRAMLTGWWFAHALMA